MLLLVLCVLCVCLLLARRHVGLLDCEIYEVIVCLEQKSPMFQYCRLID